jgi:hypothetical protein
MVLARATTAAMMVYPGIVGLPLLAVFQVRDLSPSGVVF